jgi:hypothetical protein
VADVGITISIPRILKQLTVSEPVDWKVVARAVEVFPAMSATLHLDSPHTHFTNLDYLTGKVVLTLNSEASISGIQVKLEGESRTRLSGPRHPHHEQSDKKRTELEVHKVEPSVSFSSSQIHC